MSSNLSCEINTLQNSVEMHASDWLASFVKTTALLCKWAAETLSKDGEKQKQAQKQVRVFVNTHTYTKQNFYAWDQRYLKRRPLIQQYHSKYVLGTRIPLEKLPPCVGTTSGLILRRGGSLQHENGASLFGLCYSGGSAFHPL